MKLKDLYLVNHVHFNSDVKNYLSGANCASLTYENGFVKAVSTRQTIWIPLVNVACMTPANDNAEAKPEPVKAEIPKARS